MTEEKEDRLLLLCSLVTNLRIIKHRRAKKSTLCVCLCSKPDTVCQWNKVSSSFGIFPAIYIEGTAQTRT